MIDYYNVLLNRLLALYEKRDGNVIRAIQITPSKEFKEYTDRYNHEAYR